MNPTYDFAGQVALVTGASSGMGLATAQAFAESGAAVVLADIGDESLQAATAGLSAGLSTVDLVVLIVDRVHFAEHRGSLHDGMIAGVSTSTIMLSALAVDDDSPTDGSLQISEPVSMAPRPGGMKAWLRIPQICTW
jgi:NAD(P)-dependent dehydrogenase (short-subunit alcohol dehydrogenase family)